MSYDNYNQQAAASPYSAYDEQYKTFNQPTFPSAATKITVEKVLFVPTGTYNQQWRRPWVTNYNTDNANAVHEVVAQAYSQHRAAKASGAIHQEAKYMVDPMALASVSASFIQPSAAAETQAYNNQLGGWGDQTGRFMMSLLIQRHQAVTPTRYILIGYTNHLGFTQQHIDPHMKLTINTIFEVRDVTVDHGYGNTVVQQLIAVNQVLVDTHYTGVDNADTIRMRPYEVAVALARMNDPSLQSPGVMVVDTRSTQNGSPQFSKQQHTNPNDYMANVITGLVNGRDLSIQTNRNSVAGPYHLAANALRDANANADPFITAISKIGNGEMTNTFQWRDLLRIDPGAEQDQVCFIQWRDRMQFLGSLTENMHEAGSTSDWQGQDLPTQVACQISNMLPSMMTDLAFRKVSIFASNMQGQPVCFVTNSVGIINGVDLSPQLQALQTMFEQQLVYPTTFGGQIGYNMDITADLFGEISITLKLGDQPAYSYVQPAYCSSAMSPVLTSQSNTLDNLATAFHSLQEAVLPATPVRPLVHDLAYASMSAGTTKRY